MVISCQGGINGSLWIIPFWFSALHCCFAFTLVCRYSLNKDASSNILLPPPPPPCSGAVAVSLAVPPLPQPPVLLPPGWRHSPPSLLLLPLPHLPHSLWLLSCLWPQSPGHSLKTIIPPGTRPRLHRGLYPYTTVLYKGTQYTHFLWVVLCVWLCTNTTEWLSHTFTVSENTPFFYRCLQLVLLPWLKESVPRF